MTAIERYGNDSERKETISQTLCSRSEGSMQENSLAPLPPPGGAASEQ
jgi:hypothetical protein